MVEEPSSIATKTCAAPAVIHLHESFFLKELLIAVNFFYQETTIHIYIFSHFSRIACKISLHTHVSIVRGGSFNKRSTPAALRAILSSSMYADIPITSVSCFLSLVFFQEATSDVVRADGVCSKVANPITMQCNWSLATRSSSLFALF